MPSDQFLRFRPGHDLFEYVREGKIMGVVWRGAAGWHADPFNTAKPKITEDTMEAAAALL